VESPMLRCIDVEGGSVDRLRDLIAPMPSPFAVAATNKPALFKKHGGLIGQEVHLLGFNTAFAPVLDLRTDASEPVMTTRVVSGDPAQVIRYATNFLMGLRGMVCWAPESISQDSAAGRWTLTISLLPSQNLSTCCGKKICFPTASSPGSCLW
jgi:beta-glucosidase-like glycosyl hydrolase